ncbi:hypothetical protein CEXT_438381 [Caerostris extrusa]|uniref:Uncharacterized protein n=1 Tax=Caerostris extrusa TaxID=172846 RepID=A0AAV4T3F6_CAEEX|nr:hypothetical protein CEXT_438381 [Caerostris extrusa]
MTLCVFHVWETYKYNFTLVSDKYPKHAISSPAYPLTTLLLAISGILTFHPSCRRACGLLEKIAKFPIDFKVEILSESIASSVRNSSFVSVDIDLRSNCFAL